MSDRVPSIAAQGLEVRFVKTALRTYNSGLLWRDGHPVLCSRRFNPETKRSELWWQDETDAWPVGVPARFGYEHIEDGRVFEHNGKLYVAYTDGDYRGERYVSRQGLARLRKDLTVDQTFRIAFGGNYGERSEKNWQFFSPSTGSGQATRAGLHFVYSIAPHVVVALNKQGKVAEQWRTSPPIAWPWGTLSGGTPPVRCGDRYVSFFHSFLPHEPRARRYSMAAYAFAARPPFEIVAISEPLLHASAQDETLPHPGHPEWDPIVVFPCGAHHEVGGGRWTVSAGVNDSYDALIQIRDEQIQWRSVAEWARSRTYYFRTINGACPVAAPGHGYVRWQPVGEAIGGAREGVCAVSTGAILLTLRTTAGVREIGAEEYHRLARKAA